MFVNIIVENKKASVNNAEKNNSIVSSKQDIKLSDEKNPKKLCYFLTEIKLYNIGYKYQRYIFG